MIGTQASRFGFGVCCAVEHPTNRYAVDACMLDAEADDAPSEHVHDQHDPMAVQQDRFAAEQINAPKTVLRLGKKAEPARAWNQSLRAGSTSSGSFERGG